MMFGPLLLASLFILGNTNVNFQPPRFLSHGITSPSIVTEGHAKILQCQAVGFPQPQIRWFKDGEAIGNFTSESFFKIARVEKHDAGEYQCVAKNDVGAVFGDKIKILVAFRSDEVNLKNITTTVTSGDAVLLKPPEIDSYPSPTVTWHSSDNLPLYGSKYAVDLKGRLVILSSENSDMKSYRAHLTFTQLGSEVLSGFINLIVESGGVEEIAPRIIVAPENSKFVAGAPLGQIECIANARPLYQLEILWFKDDLPIEEADISYSFGDPWNRTLTLINIVSRHTGQYQCKARLRSAPSLFGEALCNVTVLEKPYIISHLRHETVGELEKTIGLPCKVAGFPVPRLQWFRNTKLLTSTERVQWEENYDERSLIIHELKSEDAGMYQCVADNEAGEESTVTWLKVKTAPPVWKRPPEDLIVPDGEDAMLFCQATGAPQPNVTWYHEDTVLAASFGRVQILDSGDLLIAAVRSSDNGNYTCFQKNEAGSVSGSSNLTVFVKTRVIHPPVDTNVILGHTATMQCKVSSHQSISYEISWFHNDNPVNVVRSRFQLLEDGSLDIVEARASDAGIYKCQVISKGGNETREAYLNVIELPYAPLSVQAELLQTSSRSANVSWNSGFDGNSPILKYIVQKRIVSPDVLLSDHDLSWTTIFTNVSENKRWVLVSDLQAASSYQFRIIAVNSVGEGAPSAPSQVLILPQEPPSAPPVNFVGSARSASAIMIQWQPPASNHQNGQILGYVVKYRLYGYGTSPWSFRNITNEAQINYLIENLITWKDYEISIAAYNTVGLGTFANSLKIRTREGVPDAPPTQLQVYPLNSTAVSVSWLPPDPQKINGINQGYKIQAWKEYPNAGAEPFQVKTVPPSLFDPFAKQIEVLSNLEKFTSYYITVLCFTNPGDGEPSNAFEVHTLEDVPGPVQNLKFENITDRSVSVLWSPPEEQNGILLGYGLEYSVQDSHVAPNVYNVTSNVTKIDIIHLKALTHYIFEIYGWTRIGVGPSVFATLQSGIEPVLPEPPVNLALSNIEAFSVVLQFSPGFNGNSSISKWIIEAQTGPSSDWNVIQEIHAPLATTLHITNLIPFMQYKLRIKSHNIVGTSSPSKSTKQFQTLQASPSHPPLNVTVRALNSTEIRVRWIPLQLAEWYGSPRGYKISYRSISSNETKMQVIDDYQSNSFTLERLKEFSSYTISVTAFNDVGESLSSPLVVEKTRESVPSEGPSLVTANATSSTTIEVHWNDIPQQFQNGIIEGYKVYYGNKNIPFKYKDVPGNTSYTTTLTELYKYTQYQVQVLGYTRLGDGHLTTKLVQVLTHPDLPGPPSNLSFPDVSLTMARIIWDTPSEPNGILQAYRITYHAESSPGENMTSEMLPSARTYRATNLEPLTYYLFIVTAKTDLGWGKSARALVYTTNNRDAPQPPSAPQISRSQILSDSISFSWTPGRDGFAPLRYYTVQMTQDDSSWVTMPDRLDPMLTYYTITRLKPFTSYRFRIKATNDIGASGWSEASNVTKTLPAAPVKVPSNLIAIPITTTSVQLEWEPLALEDWNGDSETGGYRIKYNYMSDFPSPAQVSPKKDILDIMAHEVTLDDLVKDKNYEITIISFNSQGESPASRPLTVYVGEAVPTGEPRQLTGQSISTNQVILNWEPPLENQQNGDLLGYKIFYHSVFDDNNGAEEIEVVPPSSTSYSLLYLDTFTKYTVQILAFNPAGDGPRSPAILVHTLPGAPGPPQDLLFHEITMTGLKVVWLPPDKPNGEILYYLVTYRTTIPNEEISKEVKMKVTGTQLIVQDLEEEVSYTFSVKGWTVDYGPEITRNITTGPQIGSPGSLYGLHLSKTFSSVVLRWKNNDEGHASILGYYIESKKKDEPRWETVIRTEQGQMDEFTIPFQNLHPAASYKFRVMSYNKYGISPVSVADEIVDTPIQAFGFTHQPPFYHQPMFLVILAASSLVVIILVIAVLCVRSSPKKIHDDHDEKHGMDPNCYEDNSFAAFELCNSRQTSLRHTLSRKSAVGKPPIPSPGSILYSDEESVKDYDENPDDSSLTEKPSEISSTDSQASESENESEHSVPHSFVNHYANVNDTLRQSWKRQKPVAVTRNYSSYTDSEQEGSAVVTLNGGQIIMNNMAGSRAPLPGFSSFV